MKFTKQIIKQRKQTLVDRLKLLSVANLPLLKEELRKAYPSITSSGDTEHEVGKLRWWLINDAIEKQFPDSELW